MGWLEIAARMIPGLAQLATAITDVARKARVLRKRAHDDALRRKADIDRRHIEQRKEPP